MRKLSQINEGVFSDILKRDNGDEIRQEDFDKFGDALKKIQQAEHFDMGGFALWTSFNFGASRIDEPGWYMDYYEIMELKEYLKDTDYYIPDPLDWNILSSRNKFEIKKIGKYYTFFSPEHDFYLPKFGWISAVTVKQGEDTISNSLKTGIVPYSFSYFGGLGCMDIKKDRYGHLHNSLRILPFADRCEKIQVRLVKKQHK